MRYFQFTQWVEHGGWYLQPISGFNPQDGVLIHWSRLPDIPLALVSILVKPFTSPETAYAIAMITVPGLYLLGITAAAGKLTARIMGNDYMVLACFYLLSTHLTGKFFPGSIDHHNIQLLLAAWFIALLPLNHDDCKSTRSAIICGFLLALSFWTGLENLIFFGLLLLYLTIRGYSHSLRFVFFCRTLCLSAILFSFCFCLLNRPVAEFTNKQIDALSWPYLLCLLCGLIFCQLSVYFRRPANRIIKYLLIGIISLFPMLLFSPEVFLGVYYQYPALLNQFWLSKVSEAISIIGYIKEEGLFGQHNYLLSIIPALLSVIFIRHNERLKQLYLVMLLLILPALFWQARTVFLIFIIAAPFQAYFVIYCIRKIPSVIAGMILAIICMPACITITSFMINQQFHPEIKPGVSKENSKPEVVRFLKQHQIVRQKILAPIEFGTPILTLTDNAVISAPYHRNIRGNTLAIKILTGEEESGYRQLLEENKFNYILIGNDNASTLLKQQSGKNSLINRLDQHTAPQWLSLTAQGKYGLKLYRIHFSGHVSKETEETGLSK
ncbi:hypothetical protein [Vibrio quintilis]|nr:hypothetical protein [Vibrio quintilis]